MEKSDDSELVKYLSSVLKENDRGGWTVPAANLYPHQWLWDSCFIAIGLRHQDPDRAQTELLHLLRGQWENGMLPHMIFAEGEQYRRDREQWRSYVNPLSPHGVATSGITQPPMLAEAVVQVGKKLTKTERRSWYRQMYHPILNYHQWLYAERNPHQEGLVINIHPYETGLDSSPPWLSELRKHSMPAWVTAIERLHMDGFANLFRRDTRHAPPGQRMTNIEAMSYWDAMLRLRRKAYNSEAILSRSLFAVEDLTFNSILIRANSCLKEMAAETKQELPPELLINMKKTAAALEQLWDEQSGQYYCRSFISHKLIEEPTIATFMPLYSGAISKDHAARLVEILKKRRAYALAYPVPSVPFNSPQFDEYRYWQGPTWVNTNWLIIMGLERYGYKEEADALRRSTIEMVQKAGSWEYFSPLDGSAAGAENFSWTAALTLDLLNS